MTRDEFCHIHWNYYMILEADFVHTERYLSFDLGDNYLYYKEEYTDIANSLSYSVEFVKQYQTICSKVEMILKTICSELGYKNKENITGYTTCVLGAWPDIALQKAMINDIELIPFMNWSMVENETVSPEWWRSYNAVKHNRIKNIKQANLKNILNALAGLYILGNYLVKHIADRDDEPDVPNDCSKIFQMVNWKTNSSVFGKELYTASKKDLDQIIDNLFKPIQ